MAWLMLPTSWPGNFQRTIRDKQGKEIGVMHFTPGEPVEVEAEVLAGLKKDIGPALVWCQLTPEGVGVGKPHPDQSQEPHPPKPEPRKHAAHAEHASPDSGEHARKRHPG